MIPKTLRVAGVAWLMSLAGSFSFAARAHDAEGYYGPHMMWGGGWGGMFMGPLMMIIFLVVTVGAVVLIVRWFGGFGHGPKAGGAHGSQAIQILEERFARGEIDKDEFDERRRILAD